MFNVAIVKRVNKANTTKEVTRVQEKGQIETDCYHCCCYHCCWLPFLHAHVNIDVGIVGALKKQGLSSLLSHSGSLLHGKIFVYTHEGIYFDSVVLSDKVHCDTIHTGDLRDLLLKRLRDVSFDDSDVLLVCDE